MSASDAERQLVVFSLHGEHYGLPITSVREITRYTAPSATAMAQGLIQGMISWRSTVLPVVDLSSRLGKQLEVGEKTRILVLELANGSLGLIADSVQGVISIPEANIKPLPVAGSDLFDQIAAVDERLIMLIDPERALGSALPDRTPAKAPVKRRSRPSSGSRPPAR